MRLHAVILGSLSLALCASCSRQPAAKDVCARLESEHLASGCHEALPKGLGARASALWDFDVPGTPGATGGVYTFATADDYKATVEGFAAAAILAGPHRYGSERARVFVQVSDKAPLDYGKKLKATIEGL